jgi:hypothetical protein
MPATSNNLRGVENDALNLANLWGINEFWDFYCSTMRKDLFPGVESASG